MYPLICPNRLSATLYHPTSYPFHHSIILLYTSVRLVDKKNGESTGGKGEKLKKMNNQKDYFEREFQNTHTLKGTDFKKQQQQQQQL